jgi:hypothetical protein
MIEVSAERLLEISRELAAAGERFHNHVLSSDCKLNVRQQCALIVEASDREEVYVTYSDEPMMDVGRTIATLVHGEDPLAAAGADSGEDVQAESVAVAEMMRRAEDLVERGIHWHHHILFPECVFNPHPGDWTLVFEDPESGETLESVTTDKPEEDIRVTETMFFSQTVHS